MDRLVCGDVGFGKTELPSVPHSRRHRRQADRCARAPPPCLPISTSTHSPSASKIFPCVSTTCREPVSAKEVTRQILADLAEGKIDILIGTHKLIGKSVKFKDLGLLIVDEEQKFGVAVKERLKQLKVNVDTPLPCRPRPYRAPSSSL